MTDAQKQELELMIRKYIDRLFNVGTIITISENNKIYQNSEISLPGDWNLMSDFEDNETLINTSDDTKVNSKASPNVGKHNHKWIESCNYQYASGTNSGMKHLKAAQVFNSVYGTFNYEFTNNTGQEGTVGANLYTYWNNNFAGGSSDQNTETEFSKNLAAGIGSVYYKKTFNQYDSYDDLNTFLANPTNFDLIKNIVHSYLPHGMIVPKSNIYTLDNSLSEVWKNLSNSSYNNLALLNNTEANPSVFGMITTGHLKKHNHPFGYGAKGDNGYDGGYKSEQFITKWRGFKKDGNSEWFRLNASPEQELGPKNANGFTSQAFTKKDNTLFQNDDFNNITNGLYVRFFEKDSQSITLVPVDSQSREYGLVYLDSLFNLGFVFYVNANNVEPVRPGLNNNYVNLTSEVGYTTLFNQNPLNQKQPFTGLMQAHTHKWITSYDWAESQDKNNGVDAISQIHTHVWENSNLVKKWVNLANGDGSVSWTLNWDPEYYTSINLESDNLSFKDSNLKVPIADGNNIAAGLMVGIFKKTLPNNEIKSEVLYDDSVVLEQKDNFMKTITLSQPISNYSELELLITSLNVKSSVQRWLYDTLGNEIDMNFLFPDVQNNTTIEVLVSYLKDSNQLQLSSQSNITLNILCKGIDSDVTFKSKLDSKFKKNIKDTKISKKKEKVEPVTSSVKVTKNSQVQQIEKIKQKISNNRLKLNKLIDKNK